MVITIATHDAASNVTNKYLQNAIRLIGVNSFMVGIFGVIITSSAVGKQNLEKF